MTVHFESLCFEFREMPDRARPIHFFCMVEPNCYQQGVPSSEKCCRGTLPSHSMSVQCLLFSSAALVMKDRFTIALPRWKCRTNARYIDPMKYVFCSPWLPSHCTNMSLTVFKFGKYHFYLTWYSRFGSHVMWGGMFNFRLTGLPDESFIQRNWTVLISWLHLCPPRHTLLSEP